MIKQIAKDIFIIKVPLPGNPLKNINSYYIKGKNRNLLIDTGFNTQVCYDVLKLGLEELNADMANSDIFLTHLHTDHSGLCGKIASNSSKIYISETDAKYLKELYNPEYLHYLDNRSIAFGFSMEELEENNKITPILKYLPSKHTEFTGIKDGFKLDLGNYNFRCIETPGHTPGHMCLYDENHKILFSGDHVIFDITPNITPWKNIDNSLKLYMNSLERIKKLDIINTFSAHRRALGDCRQRIDELMVHHMRRINETYGIVRNFHGMTAYKVASKMKWSIRAKDWADFPIVQKWFAVGEAASHLDYLVCEGAVKKELIEGKYLYY